ncbi:small peptidoglycan-associated lipoprotein [Bacillus sp. DTU_2020_1000418_1_SI_GHA_SEK_038]|uniref:small peptidoglycan-associated lipoprotein n=1 Tax=Bacillus sp. DTU_2020_1000418_1_SI_GHA_SEK_038 TaxID=3077585 RepID=UPI0028E8E5C1|nr:small peptidoglycan-associated lipoprotein [Bacillus sp. DTU_2020_1000418_1_SI_GHA_SEK_038]WNS77014.1 small peptidoglycan-associated lipoprotein [Bacillus sp. DTU_2020_1000418_1_SI_GHA_SEK_038]
MKVFSLFFIASFLFITSCNHFKPHDELIFDKNSKQILFFSNEKDYEEEASYYDAIIELKKEFPEEIKNMKIISSDKAKRYYETFDVQSSPTILIIHQEKVIVKIKGDTSAEQIIKPISNALKGELSTSN